MFIAKLGSLAGLAQGSLATGADVQANTNTVDDDALLVHVRAEIPACAALGETHIISERLGLATDITLPGHGQLPSNHISRRNDSGIQCRLGRRRAEITISSDVRRGTKASPYLRQYNAES